MIWLFMLYIDIMSIFSEQTGSNSFGKKNSIYVKRRDYLATEERLSRKSPFTVASASESRHGGSL